MFTYAHTQVPAYVHSSAGQLVKGVELNKETGSPDFFLYSFSCVMLMSYPGNNSTLYASFNIPDYC